MLKKRGKIITFLYQNKPYRSITFYFTFMSKKCIRVFLYNLSTRIFDPHVRADIFLFYKCIHLTLL